MSPFLRKFALAAHIISSVGWLGAIVPYLALAIAGLTSNDARFARGAYVSMELIGWYVIVPLSLAALLSGLIQSLGTSWGLVRHWWIIAKLGLTTGAVFVLLGHMQAVSRMSRLATDATFTAGDFRAERIQLFVHAAGGLFVLLAVTAISVFKPWGLTAYGRRHLSKSAVPRRSSEEAEPTRITVFPTRKARWSRIIGVHAIALFLLFVFLHLAGGGVGRH